MVVAAPFATLALGDPAPALVALPLALFLVVGLVMPGASEPVMELELDSEETVEDAFVPFEVGLVARASVAHVKLKLPEGVHITSATGARLLEDGGLVVPLRNGKGEVRGELAAGRWGAYLLGKAEVTVTGPLRIRFHTASISQALSLVVVPDEERTRSLVEPLVTNMHTGDVTSAYRGSGLEIAEMRRWAPGDPGRAINWRATARSDDVWVTDRFAERNGDLMLVVDSLVAPGSDVEGSVRRVVEIAAALVGAYGRQRHRLGLLSLGGPVRWFGLDSGAVHEHRLLAALLAIGATSSPIWMAVDRVFDRTLRRPSMVVFITPLMDAGVAGRIRRLARSGLDVVAIAVDPASWMRQSADAAGRLAPRIWRMERERTISRLRADGVAVGEWRPEKSLDELLEEVERWRRRLRRARV